MKTKLKDIPKDELRMTRQRRMILDACSAPGHHYTADDVYMAVKQTLPNISLATVYRNLEILSRAGLIRTLHLGGGQRLYDSGLHPHYHVRCVHCGRVSDVPAEQFGDLDVKAQQTSNYQILDHELGFEGVCADCRASSLLRTGGAS